MRFLVLFMVGFSSLSALAQSITQQELGACAALTSDFVKLQCFEQLTKNKQPPTDSTLVAPELSTGIEITSTTEAPALSTPSINENTGVIAVESDPAEFVLEQLPKSRSSTADSSLSTITATVVQVSQDSRKHLNFHLDNGQMWRQIEARYLPYPKNRPFEVQMRQGFLGEYRLRIEGSGRLVRIRRIK